MPDIPAFTRTAPKIASLVRIGLGREALYAAALAVLVLLAAGEWLIIRNESALKGPIGSLISLAERQRLLTERTALAALGIVSAGEEGLASYFKNELSLISRDLARNHAALVHGDPGRKLSGAISPAGRAILFGEPELLDGKIDDFLTDLRAVAKSAGPLEPDDPGIRNVLSGSRPIVKGLGRLVDAEIAELERTTERLARLETLLGMICLGSILALAALCLRVPKDGTLAGVRSGRSGQDRKSGRIRSYQRTVTDAGLDGPLQTSSKHPS